MENKGKFELVGGGSGDEDGKRNNNTKSVTN